MKLNFKNIKQLSQEEILELLLPHLKKIYRKYDYLEISEKQFYDIVIIEIIKSKETYKDNIDYISYIKKNITNVLKIEIEKMLNKSGYTIINNFINKRFNTNLEYETIIQNFNNLNKFLSEYKYNINNEIIIKLLKENILFYKMIEILFKTNQEKIISNNIYELFNNTLITIIETYCMINNIEIKISEEYIEDISEIENCDSLKRYLLEISKRPILTKQEEVELMNRINNGDESAKEIFIESNLKLVVSIAKRYINMGLPLLDLIQEGNIGLINALNKFDVNLGLKFSNYASYWIRDSITKALADKGKIIRIPVYVYKKIGILRRTITDLEKQLKREPTLEEIANNMKIPVNEVVKLFGLQNDIISTNVIMGDDKKDELESFISSEIGNPEDKIIMEDMKLQVKKFLKNCNLKQDELTVLLLKYGFIDNRPFTYEEISKIIGKTRQRACQIEKIALTKIRNSNDISIVTGFIQDEDVELENIKSYKKNYE